MNVKKSIFAAAAAATLLVAGLAVAQAPAGGPPPPPKDQPASAPAGTYNVDPGHASIIARVVHQGTSYSTFRFFDVAGSLTWDPANAANNKVTSTVQTASISGVPAKHPDGSLFMDGVKGERFLNVAKFPTATFTSTKFTKVDAKHAKVEGNFTLMGVTKPLTFDVTFVGATPQVVGMSATSKFMATEFGLPAFFAQGPVELQLDVEFRKPAA